MLSYGLRPARSLCLTSSRSFAASTSRRSKAMAAPAAADRVLRGVVFDMDGTLTVPVLDFRIVREKIGISAGTDILAHIKSLQTESERSAAMQVVLDAERLGIEKMQLRQGCRSLLSLLRRAGAHTGLLTRNAPVAVDALLKILQDADTPEGGDYFSPIVTRHFQPPKPSPAPLLHICESWNISPQEVMFVGDDVDDLRCGKAAGCLTVLINTEKNREKEWRSLADIVIAELTDLEPMLQPHFKA